MSVWYLLDFNEDIFVKILYEYLALLHIILNY